MTVAYLDEVTGQFVAAPETTRSGGRGGILAEAHNLVGGDRQKEYGHPLDTHKATAGMWNSWLERRLGKEISLSAEDVALMLVMVKLAREAHAHKHDNLLDAIGYLESAEECRLERGRRDGAN